MKTFTIVPAFALLLSNVSAKWVQGSGIVGKPPVLLDDNEPLEFRFSDLKPYSFSAGTDPTDTVMVSVKTLPSKTKQTVIFDIGNIREVVHGAPLSISGCDVNGINCYPAIKDPNVPRPFDQDQLKDGNTAILNVSTFASPGSSFILYLQLQRDPGHDNPSREPGTTDHGPKFSRMANYEKQDDIAFTISLKTDMPMV